MSATFGALLHGEFSSANASALTEAASRFALYGGGLTTALTLGAKDVVYVSALVIACGSNALTVTIYDGADNVADPGELVARVSLLAGTSSIIDFSQSARKCQIGTYIHLKTSGAGQIDGVLYGNVNREQEL